MRNRIIILLGILLIAIVLLNTGATQKQNADSDSNQLNMHGVPPYYQYNHYPIPIDYYQEIMNFSVGFNRIKIKYYMGISDEYPDARNQGLSFSSRLQRENGEIISITLDEIDYFPGRYVDTDNRQCFYYSLPSEIVMPIFLIIQSQSDYYFNAEEFEGEESLLFGSPMDIGIKNHIMLSIEPSDKIL